MGKKKKTSKQRSPRRGGATAAKNLVIVESPAKAKTINKYLGPDFVVKASIGHVRDLPSRNPKGVKQPIPGVDLENNFAPTYEILPRKKKTVAELKRAARDAENVWFATDLDREGEAIAWHLAQELGIDPRNARRVIFNAITKSEIEHAFQNPRPIDQYKVNAQQARRILDRIVGYQVSPLLWKKVARGLSAGRVQSVAVRLIVERERAIRAFLPDENWKIAARLTLDADRAGPLASAWRDSLSINHDENNGKAPTVKEQNAWMAEHHALRAELVEFGGEKFELTVPAESETSVDLSERVRAAAEGVGLIDIDVSAEHDPDGKGRAATKLTVSGDVDPATRYRIASIETKKTTSRPRAPFITSTLQMAASSSLGFGAQRTMRVAQSLYEGVNVAGEGEVGLITYMRTDSTHLSSESIDAVRNFIENKYGSRYLPGKANLYAAGKDAQEAHEAIRPTDANRHPDAMDRSLDAQQAKLYRLIWQRFVACQMTPAEWEATTVLMRRSDRETGAVLKTTGRVLLFDGFYRASGVPTAADEQTLPQMSEGRSLAPFSIEPEQVFSSPPPRFTEASLVKELEADGIGRPSTYAAIIQVIQDRNYVEQISRRFHATDLGEVVTDKLVEGFPRLMDVGYTREMEAELDKIEEQHIDWVDMLNRFYARFSEALERAHETMTHAKAEMKPAPYKCPTCGRRTNYRFGKNGRFLSCAGYPDCEYAAPIDREGRPLLPEHVNVACPDDGSPMVLRTGRFGRFLASANYPEVECIINVDRQDRLKYPAPPPFETDLACPTCDSPLYLRRGKRGPWLGCSRFPKCRGRLAWSKIETKRQAELKTALEEHLRRHPPIVIRTLDGEIIADGTPIDTLLMPGGVAELEIHQEAGEAT